MMRWSLLLSSILFASVALAEPPTPEVDEDLTELIEAQLVTPLRSSERKRSKFSRAMPMPTARRIRVLRDGELTDAQGKSFVRFVVDERRSWNDEGEWTARFTGCVYPEEQAVYVKQGKGHAPAKSVLKGGGATSAVVCREGGAKSGEIASAH